MIYYHSDSMSMQTSRREQRLLQSEEEVDWPDVPVSNVDVLDICHIEDVCYVLCVVMDRDA